MRCKTFQRICASLDVNFNELLTNDVVSFEQLGPEYLYMFCFSVYAFPVPEDKSGQQVVDSLQRQVEQLGAVKTGNFCVDCETYQSNAQIGTEHVLKLCVF